MSSKFLFCAILVCAVIRDSFTDASNDELSLYLIAGMLIVVAFKLVFDQPTRIHHE